MRDSINDLPDIDSPKQRWLFLLYESPANCPNYNANSKTKSLYSLSSTYKINSDFPGFYESGR